MTEKSVRNRSAMITATVMAICLIAAGTLYFRGSTSAAFIIATLGVVAWFVNLRFRLKKEIRDSEPRSDDDDLSVGT